jgi:hypothetical protein
VCCVRRPRSALRAEWFPQQQDVPESHNLARQRKPDPSRASAWNSCAISRKNCYLRFQLISEHFVGEHQDLQSCSGSGNFLLRWSHSLLLSYRTSLRSPHSTQLRSCPTSTRLSAFLSLKFPNYVICRPRHLEVYQAQHLQQLDERLMTQGANARGMDTAVIRQVVD